MARHQNLRPCAVIVFITSVRHPENAKSYHRVWRLLNATLISVCNQTDENFRVIVVCNKILPLAKNVEKIEQYTEFITVDFPPVAKSGWDSARCDKSLKYTIAVIAAQKHNPNHLMIFDADDFISSDIAEYVNAHPEANGFFIDKGYCLLRSHLIALNNFHEICGTSHILRFDLLCEKIPKSLTVQSSRQDIIKAVDKFFLLMILPEHKHTATYFAKSGKPLGPFPKRAVVWFLGTGENHSAQYHSVHAMIDRVRTGKLTHRPIKPSDVAYFSLSQKRTRFVDRAFFVAQQFYYDYLRPWIRGLKS